MKTLLSKLLGGIDLEVVKDILLIVLPFTAILILLIKAYER